MTTPQEILRLPRVTAPTELLIYDRWLTEENVLRAFQGQRMKRTQAWVGLDVVKTMQPPFIILDEK